jgi:hypothetical protein
MISPMAEPIVYPNTLHQEVIGFPRNGTLIVQKMHPIAAPAIEAINPQRRPNRPNLRNKTRRSVGEPIGIYPHL